MSTLTKVILIIAFIFVYLPILTLAQNPGDLDTTFGVGGEVATLLNEEKPSGSYDVEFDAIGLPSGIYFYQLKTSNYIVTNKMILLK